MVALNFKSQFSEAIKIGTKRRTIRARRKDKRDPKIGDILQLYTGMRQKNCTKLRDAMCTNVRAVTIDTLGVSLGGGRLTVRESVAFALADGFDCYESFLKFFREQHGLPFSGLMIEWA